MKRKRRKHTPEFKARVAFEAIQGLKTQTEIAKEFKIHPVMAGQWKKEIIEPIPALFAGKVDKDAQVKDKGKIELERKVGQLTMDVDFLEKKCKQMGIPLKGRNT